jgi:membrane fusion protein, multidrug efflux system
MFLSKFGTSSSAQWAASMAVGAGVLAMVACSRQAPVEEPVRSVKLLTVGTTDLNAQAEYAADIRARIESRLGFRVAGKLVQRQAEAGQRVQAGQVLAQIDPQDYQLAAQAAQAQLAAAQTQRDLSQAELRRFEGLRAQNFISSVELERREAAFKAADATLAQARAQAQAQGNQAAYARLQATTSGVVTGVEAEVGQVVTAGQPVVRLAHDGPRDAVFAVPEQAVMAFKPGQAMQAVLTSTGQVLKGRVREVGASADPVTRTFTIKLALDASEKLPLGVTVNVQAGALQGSQPPVIKLPTSALRQEGAGTVVWVLDEAAMTVRSQPVQVGTVDGNQVVIASGLQAGQKVVAAGVHVLTAGQKVTVYVDPAAAPAIAASAPANTSAGR